MPYSTEDGTATTADGDYVASNGTLSFNGDGGETKTFTVQVNGDADIEGNETFKAVLGAPSSSYITIEQSPLTVTIMNDDGANLAVSDAVVVEGNSGTKNMQFTVTLNDAVDTSFTVNYDSADSTATTADSDYTATSGTVTFVGTANEQQTFNVPIKGDAKVELNEAIFVNISEDDFKGRGITISDSQGVGTITNNDAATLSISNVSKTEDDSGMTNATLTVTLNQDVDAPVAVQFASADNTASTSDNDYTANSGTLNFSGTSGEQKTIQVAVKGDSKVELDEAFFVNLTNATSSGRDVTISDAQGVGTITNDDAATISINDVTKAETDSGTTNFSFTATLDNAVDTGVSVDYATADDTAESADNDYTTKSGTLNFSGSAGETETVTIIVNGDTDIELTEMFDVLLSNLTATGRSVTLSDATGVGNITNDDSPNTVTLAVSSATGSEANETVITVRAIAAQPVVQNQTVQVSVAGTDITSGDYMLSQTTITIPNGETEGSVTFTVVDDATVESTETATLTISDPSTGIVLGATLEKDIAITDNDTNPSPAVVTLSVSSASASEADETVITVRATASQAVVQNQTVSVGVSGANITTGDYTLSNATIMILNGQTEGTVTFTIVDDSLVENVVETATLTLSAPSSGIVLGTPVIQNITITDNDVDEPTSFSVFLPVLVK